MSFVKIILLLFIFITAGCATGGVIIRETPLNVSDSRKAITTVIGVPIKVSQNGRELYSHYHDGNRKKIDKPESVRERYQTVVIVLGDRRPYDIQVKVNRQVKGPEGRFEFLERDDYIADEVAEKIRHSLNQGRGQRNVIDDFRSF